MAEARVDRPGDVRMIEYRRPTDLAAVRGFVQGAAEQAGLAPARAQLLALAVSELATNTLEHTAAGGLVTVWAEPDAVLCEVHDQGPLAAREVSRPMPAATAVRGRGLAIVERVCDEVSLHTVAGATVVRLRMGR